MTVPSATTLSPARTHCPDCGTRLVADVRRPARPLPASGRCGTCRRRIGPPFALLELGTAGCLAGLAAVLGPAPELVAYSILATVGVGLVAIDWAVSRLPDHLVLPLYPLVLAALAVAALIDGEPLRVGSALLGMLTLGGIFLVLGMLRPGQMGGGDVKLAGLVGLPLGWLELGWGGLLGPLVGGALAFGMFGAVAIGLIYARRISRYSAMQLGPFIIAGAFAVLLAS